MIIECPNCGNKINISSKFCPECGIRIEVTAPNVDDQEKFEFNNIHPEKRHHGKELSWPLTILIVLLLTLWSWHRNDEVSDTSDSSESYMESTKTATNSANAASKASIPTKTATDSANATARASIPTTVIYDNGGILVKVYDLKNEEEFSYTVENKSDNDISFAIYDVAVNNCMVFDEGSGAYSKYVTPGCYASDTYSIKGKQAYGSNEPVKTINIIADVTVYADEDYQTQTFSGTIKTSQFDQYGIIPKITGYTAYEDQNVKVMTTSNGSEDLTDFGYYIENKSEYDIEVDFSAFSANGQMCDLAPIYSLNALPYGYSYSKAVSRSGITIYSAFEDEVSEKGFDQMEILKANLTIYLSDKDSGNNVDYYAVDGVVLYKK